MTERTTPERALEVAMMGLLAGLVGVGVLRLFDVAAHPILVAVTGLAPLLLCPVYLVAGYAAAERRPVMGGLAVALVLCQLVWLERDYALTSAYDGCQSASTCFELTIASGNLLGANPNPIEAFEALTRPQPDVIVLQEAAAWDRIVGAGAAVTYPYTFTDPSTLGVAVASKLPILDVRLVDTPGRMFPLVVVDAETGPVTILAVHLLPPLSRGNITAWGEQSRAIAELTSSVDGPLVVAGDFNATGQHDAMDRILSAGLRDAHLERGSGFGATWPVGSLVPPVLRIDHVLVSDQFDVAAFDVITIPGSDHRGIVATLTPSG